MGVGLPFRQLEMFRRRDNGDEWDKRFPPLRVRAQSQRIKKGGEGDIGDEIPIDRADDDTERTRHRIP